MSALSKADTRIANFRANKAIEVPAISEAIMDAKGLDKTHRDAVREIATRVLAQLHGLAKRGKIQRISRRVGVSWVMPP